MERRSPCGHSTLDLFALADGELEGDARYAVETRVVECSACREALTRIQATNHLLMSLPADEAAPDLTGQVMGRIRSARRKRRPLQVFVAAAAAVLLFIGIASAVAPAEGLGADMTETGDPSLASVTVAVADPLGLAMEVEPLVVGGLVLALGTCGFLLFRLTNVKGV